MKHDVRYLDALLRNNFSAFVHKVFVTLNPGQIFDPNWHIAAIGYQLERVRSGEEPRLIINMPPRSLKSIVASIAFPAFALGHDPSLRIICISYSGDLAKKLSNDFRAIIESSWYRRIFPGTQIGEYKNSESEIELTARGSRLATSVGGTLTGRGGNIIIIDDPLKPDDALSEAKRSAVNQWFDNTLMTRLDDKRTGAIVLVMQRVHMDDPTGFLLGRSPNWTVLSLPAIAIADEVIPLSAERSHTRRAGEALSPREPIEVLEKLKQQIRSSDFSAQYQQLPIPPGGVMVKPHWIKRYSELPPKSDWQQVLQSWDTASKGGADNDWSVCTTWIVTKTRQFYLAHVWRQRVDYPALKSSVLRLAREWNANRVLVEDTGTGIALVQELRSNIMGITAIKPEDDKETRMAIASAPIESGHVFLPEQALWLADLETELFSFPVGRHDDQVDSISQALLYLRKNRGMYISKEAFERLMRS
jgi:predicted phage terminase large subunit-like protein